MLGKKQDEKIKDKIYKEALEESWIELRAEYKDQLKRHIKEDEMQKLDDEFFKGKLGKTTETPKIDSESKLDRFLGVMRKLANAMKIEDSGNSKGQSSNYFKERADRILGSEHLNFDKQTAKLKDNRTDSQFAQKVSFGMGMLKKTSDSTEQPIYIIKEEKRKSKPKRIVYMQNVQQNPIKKEISFSDKMQLFESKMKKMM
jgi:hypothetical protein